MKSHNLLLTWRLSLPALLCLGLALAGPGSPAAAQETPASPAWRISADASAGLVLAADAWDLASADSAAAWSLQTAVLGRYEASAWGFVASGLLDASALATLAGSITPSLKVYEAYARLDLGEWGQAFLGKRRMGLGIGTTFAPGDLVDPRSGFWDQKNGFRGLDLALSLGPDLSLRVALSLERNLEAYAAGITAKAANAAAQGMGPGTAAYQAAQAASGAYSTALDGASGPADPRLLLWAGSGEALLGRLQLALSGVYSPGYAARPSLGASLDLGGLILQAEGAVELEGGTDWYGTAGARYTWSGGASSLTLALDYDYCGAGTALLEAGHYALPSLSFTIDEVLNLYARALVDLEGPSALLSWGLTLYPSPGLDIELTALASLGDAGAQFGNLVSLSPIASPASGHLRNALGLAARIHFE